MLTSLLFTAPALLVPGVADVGISSVALGSDYVESLQGDAIELEYDLFNNGSTDVDVRIGVYLSVDDVWDAGDTLLSTEDAELDANSSGDGDAEATLPTGIADGCYSILVVIDDLDVLAESDESNNVGSDTIAVNVLIGSCGTSSGLGSNYCTAAVNSTGVAATISASGSDVVAQNDVTLQASAMPSGQFGIFVTSSTQDFVMGVGSGNLCLGGTLGRFQASGQILQVDAAGEFALPIDLYALPNGQAPVAAQPGETRYFQAWFRDTNAAGNTSNLTDGLAITFQ